MYDVVHCVCALDHDHDHNIFPFINKLIDFHENVSDYYFRFMMFFLCEMLSVEENAVNLCQSVVFDK